LELVERRIVEPAFGQVRIGVEACGICHTDAATVTSTYPGLKLPRVPGHEVVGRIEALGSGVSRWKIGQRVGVGLIAGEDGVCEPCWRGDIVNCQNPVVQGVTVDGGYAEVMIAEARGIASIPDELSSAEAAPSSARVSRPTTLFATLVCAVEIWSLCWALVGLGILGFSSRATWDSTRSQSVAEARKRSWRKI
jgi:D-arabinose 1-dehydrogenase-like Zn-dependent alcohol dehydrogenase